MSLRGLNKLLKNKNLSQKAMKQVYKTVMSVHVSHPCSSTLTAVSEQMLEVWERKVLRRIYRGVKERNVWRRTKTGKWRKFSGNLK